MTDFLRVLGWILLVAAVLAAAGASVIVRNATGDALQTFFAAIIIFANMAFLAAAGMVLADIADHKQKAAAAGDERRPEPLDGSVPPLGMGVKPEATGLLVERVEPGSAAESAGMRVGDYITHVNGVTLAHLPTLTHRVHALTGSTRLLLTVQRQERTAQVSLR